MLVLIMSVGGAPRVAAQAVRPSERLKEARQYFILEKYDRVVSECDSIRTMISDGRTYCEATAFLGAAQYMNGDKDDAETTIKDLLRECPDYDPNVYIPDDVTELIHNTKIQLSYNLEVMCPSDCYLLLDEEWVGHLDEGETGTYPVMRGKAHTLTALVACGNEGGTYKLCEEPLGEPLPYAKEYPSMKIELPSSQWCGPECNTLDLLIRGLGIFCATIIVLEVI